VTAPALPAYVAAGVAWAVGEANGLVGPDRRVTSTRLKYALEVPGSPSTYARPIRAALRGLWPWHAERGPTTPAVSTLGTSTCSPPPPARSWSGCASTRSPLGRQTVRWRDVALRRSR
jgi:hypothetical protein